MPIEPDLSCRALTQEVFYELDYRVMGVIFSVHNDLGPLFCDEHIYRNEIAHQVQRAGIANVQAEMPVSVSFRNLSKNYYVDLMLNCSAPIRTKGSAIATPSPHKADADLPVAHGPSARHTKEMRTLLRV